MDDGLQPSLFSADGSEPLGYLWELVEEMEEPSVYKDDRRWMRNVHRLYAALDSGVDSGQISRKTRDAIRRRLFGQRSPRALWMVETRPYLRA